MKDAPRPKPEDFKYSQPYLYNMTDSILNDYPEAFKRVFGLATASQADINRVSNLYMELRLVKETGDCS